jgi:MOSC domain-containing protein YiiM
MKIVSIAVSRKKGTSKIPVKRAHIIKNHGIKGDAHAGPWHRQVSFLAKESLEAVKDQGFEVAYGDFAENILTEGIEWKKVPVGSRVILGESVEIEISQIGKECHNKCAIYYKVGSCIMPVEGVFGKVIKGGDVQCGDPVKLL